MNADRRFAAQLCVALLTEAAEAGEISEESHDVLVKTVKHLQQAEYWQLRNQEKHAGKNVTTDKQIAICRVALPALEVALKAIQEDDFALVMDQLTLAATTEGEKPKKTSRKDLVKTRK